MLRLLEEMRGGRIAGERKRFKDLSNKSISRVGFVGARGESVPERLCRTN